MSPAYADFLFEALNFLLLAAGLGWLLFKPVRRMLDAEQKHRAAQQAELEQQKAAAEALARETAATREAASGEAERMRAETLSTARTEAAQMLERARHTRDEQRRAFTQELETARQAEAGQVAETVGRIAARSIRLLLDALEGPSLDTALTRGACEELKSCPPEVLRTATVESARSLDPEARRLLAETLGRQFEERIVEELGAGVRVTTSAGQVDASAAALARQAAAEMSTASSKVADQPEPQHG